MGIAQGTASEFRFKRQSAKGTLAGTSGGQIYRRESAKLTLQKDTFNGASEITTTQQMKSSRHGARQVTGNLNGIMSPGTYADFLQALLRKDAVATSSITGASITIAGAGPYTLTRAAGDFLADGIKVGDVVRLTAGTFTAGNLNKNLLVTNVVALVLTVVVVNGTALTAEGPITGATLAVPGKKTMVPDSGHTNIYYTAEEWMPDVPHSVVSQDVQVSQCSLDFPASGNVKANFGLVGLDQTSSASVYFTAPTAESTTDFLASPSGRLLVGGTAVAVVTQANVTINGNVQPANAVLGSNVRPDVFRGKVLVTGSFSAYHDGTTLHDAFLNESETTLVLLTTDGTEANADFSSVVLTRVKINSSEREDGETGRTVQYQFEALYNSAGGTGTAYDKTTVAIQDSTLT